MSSTASSSLNPPSPPLRPSPQPRTAATSFLATSDHGSQAVGKLLVKRVRMTHSKSSVSLSDVSSPPSGAVTPKLRSNASVQDCVELCQLLLEKVGADARVNDSTELDRVLTTEYHPRVADLLGRITSALDTDGILDSVSDITDSSDDERLSEPISPLPSSSVLTKNKSLTPAIAYQSDTEIAISRIFSLGQVKAVTDQSIPATAPYYGNDVVTMTCFGELGRFGNQVLQYAFLKSYAALHEITEIQVPQWIGAKLFGLNDAPVARAFPPVVEFEGTLANSTFTDELISYVKKWNVSGNTIELNESFLKHDVSVNAPRNVDIWGWFQWHSSVYAPFKSLLRNTFAPVPELAHYLSAIFDREVRNHDGRRRTVVGLHLRYGDYQNIAASSFGYCAPTSWYVEWLKEIWPTLDNPVLIVTSDDLKSVIGDFAAFNPLTADSVGLTMPESFKGMKAGFFPDWYTLTQCDVLAISNSTFSFSACLMNEREGLRVYRTHYAHRMQEINPWNADPIVHRDMNKSAVSQAVETLQILFKTQGAGAVLRNVLYELPFYGMRSVVMKAVLWREARKKMIATAST